MYSCKSCNYSTDNRWNYNKHLETNKHHKNINSSQLIPTYPNLSKNYEYICPHCNNSYKQKCHLTRHLKKCEQNIISTNELQKKIKKLEKENKKIKKENIEIKNENVELKHQIEIHNTEIEYLKKSEKQLTQTQNINSNNKITNNITQYIISTYPNAPNIEAPKEIVDKDKYIYKGYSKGFSELINDMYCKNIDPKDRSIWCVDASRNKYLLKYKDKWNIDLDGKQFCDITKDKIAQMYNDYVCELLQEATNGFPDKILSLQEFTVDVLGAKKIPNDAKKFLVFNDSKKLE